MSKQILIGRIDGLNVRTSEGLINLTLNKETDANITIGLVSLREFDGSFAVFSGKLNGSTLYEAKVVEIFTSISSMLFGKLFAKSAMIKAAESVVTEVVGPIVVTDTSTITTTNNNSSKPLCALVIGHRPSARGAVNAARNLTEFDFNSALAEEIEPKVKSARVKLFFREDTTDGYDRLPGRLNELNPDFIVSMHCNASRDASVSGTEVLHYPNSTKGEEVARILQDNFIEALHLRNRGLKPTPESGRGGKLLKNTAAPCVITEPFFIDNDGNTSKALQNRDKLINAYVKSIDSIAKIV